MVVPITYLYGGTNYMHFYNILGLLFYSIFKSYFGLGAFLLLMENLVVLLFSALRLLLSVCPRLGKYYFIFCIHNNKHLLSYFANKIQCLVVGSN